MSVSYYFDTNYGAHVIENVQPENDGLCEKAMFYGPNARHMAWAFARSYYDTNCAALSPSEQAAGVAGPPRSEQSERANPSPTDEVGQERK